MAKELLGVDLTVDAPSGRGPGRSLQGIIIVMIADPDSYEVGSDRRYMFK